MFQAVAISHILLVTAVRFPGQALYVTSKLFILFLLHVGFP